MHRSAMCWLLAGVLFVVSAPLLQAQDPPAGGQPPPDGPALVTTDDLAGNRLGPRIGIQQDFGDGLGWQHGFTRLDGFIPILQVPRQSVLFAELRGVEFDDVRLWQFDGGLGYRWYNDLLNGIIGLNGFYRPWPRSRLTAGRRQYNEAEFLV
jgi:hypothetical protein